VRETGIEPATLSILNEFAVRAFYYSIKTSVPVLQYLYIHFAAEGLSLIHPPER